MQLLYLTEYAVTSSGDKDCVEERLLSSTVTIMIVLSSDDDDNNKDLVDGGVDDDGRERCFSIKVPLCVTLVQSVLSSYE